MKQAPALQTIQRSAVDVRHSGSGTEMPPAWRYVALLVLILLAPTICGPIFAQTTDQNGWAQLVQSYNNWVPLTSLGVAPGGTYTSQLTSGEFPFTIAPNQYDAVIRSATFDDTGSIGMAPATAGDFPFCDDWPNDIHDKYLPTDHLSITPDGRHLKVDITATDDGACGNYIGWFNVKIIWRARGVRGGQCCDSCSLGVNNRCIDFAMELGKVGYQQNAGQLLVHADYPSLSLAQPIGLQALLGSMVEGITNSVTGVVRQVRTSQLLADIVVSNNFLYSVSFYTPTNFSTARTNGLYVPTGLPYRTVIVQNPDASTNTYNRLRITTTGDLGDRQYDYEWVASAQRWDLTSGAGGGLRKETRTQIWNWDGTILRETNVVMNMDSTVVFKQIETYKLFPWNKTNLVQRIVDPDGARPLTNTWAYYTNLDADGGNYSQLAQMIMPSGYWERYEYDDSTRMTKKVAQFGDAALNALESQCRVTSYSYSDTNTQSQTTTIEKLLNHEIARSYRVDFLGGVSNIVCQTVGAGLNAPDNLITVTLLYTNGAYWGQTWLTRNPDGTVSVNQYSTNSSRLTTTVFSGVPDSTGTNIMDGTKTVTVVDLGGHSITNATYDVASGLLLSSAATVQTNELGRPTVILYNDGTTETNQYGCCGVESHTDREGITTSYTYDELQRVSTVTRAGITTIYTYDAEGRVLTTTRQGTDSSQILKNTSVYDVAGRLVFSTNALKYGTTYTETNDSNGHTVKTTTNPDGSTRIETYFQDGSLQSVTGTAVQLVRYEYGADSYGAYTKEIELNSDGSDTSEWTKIYTDLVGRAYKTIYASATGSPSSQSFYNNQGQLIRQVDPDKVTTLYQYNAKGQVEYTDIDLNQNGGIDFDGVDRISRTTSDVLNDNGVNVNRTRTFVWATNDVSTSNLASTVEFSMDGLQAWNIVWHNGIGLTNYSLTMRDPGNARIVITNIAPDGSFSVTTNQNGRLISITQRDSSAAQISQTIYDYDAHGRQSTMTDARNGTTTNFFNNADQIVSITTPSPDGIQNGQATTNILDNMGRVVKTILPDGTSVTNTYYPNGLLEKAYGSRVYPVGYTYDYAGRMKTMTTWTNFSTSGGAAMTTWNYDPYRGFLGGKTYADGKGPIYYYTPAGRLMNRQWARGILTTYSHGAAGDLTGITYSDSTPSMTYGFDRLGRQVAVTNGATICAWNYNDTGQLLTESYFGGPLDGLSITNTYDNLSRRTNLLVLNSSFTGLASTAYRYDAASRLSAVSEGTNTATYTYIANSPLVGQIAFTNGVTLRMTTTKSYDYLNRLTQNQSSVSGSTVVSFNYNYNLANQRTMATNVDKSYWAYQYDPLGQVTSGKRYWADGTPVAGQQFTNNFDDIGNRKVVANGGDSTGANLRSANYIANNLNQYTSHDVPGYASVLGSANSNATVTVNLQRAYRYMNYFQDELGVNNSSSALCLSLTNLAVLNDGTNADIVATNAGTLLLAKTPETFTYDADGNLTSDGLWKNIWNSENRLISTESSLGVPTNARVRETWMYLPDGRWNQRIVSTWNGNTYVPQYTNRYVWDGQVMLAVLDQTNGLVMSFIRGLDLSGTMQEAGGVGGLLAVNFPTNGTHFLAYDGNGNVAGLVNATNGTQSANYEYGIFGEPLRITGIVGKLNPIRFGTQYADDVTRTLKYLYRDYTPNTGRWSSRDPSDEQNCLNLYGFAGNDAVNSVDVFGLWQIQRKGGDRATAISETGDTVTALAQMLRFDDKDFTVWLKPDKGSKMPTSVNAPIGECSQFTIPNTIYIEFGEMSLGQSLFGPIPTWQQQLRRIGGEARANGYKVIITDPSTAVIAKWDLKSDNTYAFAYAGHGGGGGNLIFNDRNDITSILAPTRYTPYGIPFLIAYGCSTADQQSNDSRSPGLGTRMGFEHSVWEKNVATRGEFTGIYANADGFHPWSFIINTIGTNTR